ncbi:hypothetical protein [Nocardioides sp.]|uniref:hypothetical protein n=1 Tax=Nocardioides sp. TaxID=35761 RepID=UPI001A24A0EB|nr:hypothetical protein [Nocardioides sp.]MBJ7358618.1 hypothetical protein [Nocardioides sp.]
MTTQHRDPTAAPSWSQVHAHSASLREVVRALDAGLPLPDAAAGPFADRDELLLALHGVWSRRLHGRIDVALETDGGALAECVGRAWLDTSDDLPGTRRVLDEHADEPVLQRVLRTEHRTIAVAAGLATFDDPPSASAAVGARFVATLRRRPTAPVARVRWWRRILG